MIPDPLKSTIKIPIKIVNGYPCLDPGGRLPALKDGTHGDLIVPAFSFLDPKEAQQFTAEQKTTILPKGTILVAQVSDKSIPSDLKSHVKYDLRFLAGPAVYFELKADQQLLTRGTKNAELNPCECFIPALKLPANSINHAYTLISERFEPHRTSHTANVFAKVHFEKNGTWHRLKTLRGY